MTQEKKQNGLRQEKGFTLAAPFVGYDPTKKPEDQPMYTIKERKDRIERNQRFDKMLRESSLKQWEIHHWVSEPKSPEQWNFVLREAAKAGRTLKDFMQILAQIEAEEKQAQAERSKRDEQNRLETMERNRFANRFLRECGYLKIKDPYAKNLTETAKQAPTAELLEAQARLLQRERPELSDEARNFALNWLSVVIQKRQNSDNQDPLKKARSIFNLSRGH